MKSQVVPNRGRAQLVRKVVPGLKYSGGLHSITRWESEPVAVEVAAELGGKTHLDADLGIKE